ncbi:hypothetical protein ACFVUN_35915 [Kitasatospora griseola]|uniref:hypothetical protein n=1 Tax=Kitasatospora griseola TaxID=2064 RepID=UPI0036D9E321
MPTRPHHRPTTRPGLRARIGPTALYDLHRDHYLRYAELLLPATADARLTLDAAFATIADTWAQILAAPSPAACAWHTVRDHIRALADPHRLRPTADLDPKHQDALLLHLVLALTIDEIADLTGTEAATVHAHVRSLTTPVGSRQVGLLY